MARERYLHNAGEDTIHANEITLQTDRDKRKNWWFYHRTHVIVAVLFLAMVVSIVWSIAAQVEPDYTIALMTSYAMPEDGVKELERCIAPYADDRNHDGKVVVKVANYIFTGESPYSPNEAEHQEAEYVKFVADCASMESMIFLHDETAFDLLESNFEGFFLYNDGTPMPETAGDYSNAMRPWSDLAALAAFKPELAPSNAYSSAQMSELFSRLRVSVRTWREGASNKEKTKAYHEDSMRLYRRLASGDPAAE